MAGAPWLSAALVSMGPNSDLFFNGSVSLEYQSNIFLDDPQLTGVSEVDDFAFIFSPVGVNICVKTKWIINRSCSRNNFFRN